MSTFTSVLTAAVGVTALSSATFATPALTLSLKILKQTTAGTTTQTQSINSNFYHNFPGTSFDYQVEVDGTISNLDPGFSFGSVAFDITGVTGSASRPSTAHYNYFPNNPVWTNDSGDETSPVFQISGDKGTSGSDLLTLLAVVSQDASADDTGMAFGLDAADPRLGLMTSTGPTGFNAPFKLGTFYINWTGNSSVILGVTNVQFSEINDTTTQFSSTFTNQSNPGSVTTNVAIFGSPEPASLATLTLAAAALLTRRRKV